MKLKEIFRDFITDEDKIRLYERYTAGEVDEAIVRFFLGDELDTYGRFRCANGVGYEQYVSRVEFMAGLGYVSA